MVTFEFCQFDNPEHVEALLSLYEHYMQDPMGDAPALTAEQQRQLTETLRTWPRSFVLFVRVDNAYAGLVACFELLSTFKVKPYLYIHDVIVHSRFRGQGLGRRLLDQVEAEARKRGCCKITLEVREDNRPALALYSHCGFADCQPKQYFWTKQLNS